MRKRQLIPASHQQWLNDYLARKDIKGYPDLDAKQWRLLQAAYRQVQLKERRLLNNALPVNDEEVARLLNHNAVLVGERDKARAELLAIKSVINIKKKVIEEHKVLITQLKAKVKNASHQVLGRGEYDGKQVTLAMAIKMLDSVPKDTNKQPAIRNDARVKCGYGDILERKLSPEQNVEVYDFIVKATKN